MAPKQKKEQKKTLALSEFLADDAFGVSWADDADELPTGPSGMITSSDGLGGSHLSRGSGGFAMRDEAPIPTSPPYVASINSLSYDTTEDALAEFFDGFETVNVHVAMFEGRSRGFGKVEFASAAELERALGLSGRPLDGRALRISVDPNPRGARGGFGGGFTSRADETDVWERKGPLPSAGRSGGFGGSRGGDFGGNRGGDFGAPRGDDERSWERRGPLAPLARESNFNRGPRPDDDRSWERKGPLAPIAREGGAREGFGGGFNRTRPDDDRTWERKGPLPSIERRPVERAERDEPIRGGKFVPSAPRAAAAPKSRADDDVWVRKGPRVAKPLPVSSAAPATGASSNPFGSAKPVDNSAREREVEAKLLKERQALQAKAKAIPAGGLRKEGFSYAASASKKGDTKEKKDEAKELKKEVEALAEKVEAGL